MRLIIVSNSAVTGVPVRNALTAFLEAKGWAVWHWFEDLWLIDDAPNGVNLVALREEIRGAIPTISHFVIMAAEGPADHAGIVPTPSAQWFVEHWGRR
jgi:hypothetical protein